jgi:hypothetical protein
LARSDTAPQIDFAKRHLIIEVPTFHVFSAIWRLEGLLSDLDDLKPIIEPVLETRWPRFFEFVSFYKVGFVTCLEWHAKSRLYDLFVSQPKAIGADDIKRGLSDSKLLQMIGEGLTIPHLLASATSISTKETYIATMNRVLNALGGTGAMNTIMNEVIDSESNAQVLGTLYEDRNALVHEISMGEVGHWNVRSYTEIDEAWRIGNRVLGLIKKIEAQIARFAPRDFPNLLDAEGSPVDEDEHLQQSVKKLEAEIERAILAGKSLDGLTVDNWKTLTNKAGEYVVAEIEFIDGLSIPGWQYYDVRPFLRQNLIKQRLRHLQLISKEIVETVEAVDAGTPDA